MIGYAQLRAIQWDESGYSTIGVNAVSPYCNAPIARYRAAYAIFRLKINGLYFPGVLDVFACFTSSAVLTVLLGFPRGQAVGLERYSHAIFLPEKLCLVEVSNLHLQRIDVKVGREHVLGWNTGLRDITRVRAASMNELITPTCRHLGVARLPCRPCF